MESFRCLPQVPMRDSEQRAGEGLRLPKCEATAALHDSGPASSTPFNLHRDVHGLQRHSAHHLGLGRHRGHARQDANRCAAHLVLCERGANAASSAISKFHRWKNPNDDLADFFVRVELKTELQTESLSQWSRDGFGVRRCGAERKGRYLDAYWSTGRTGGDIEKRPLPGTINSSSAAYRPIP